MTNKSEHFGKPSWKTAPRDQPKDLARVHESSLMAICGASSIKLLTAWRRSTVRESFVGTVIEIEASISMHTWIWFWVPDQLMMWSSFVLFITSPRAITRLSPPSPRMLPIASWGRPVNSHVIDMLLALSYCAHAWCNNSISTVFFPRLAITCK